MPLLLRLNCFYKETLTFPLKSGIVKFSLFIQRNVNLWKIHKWSLYQLETFLPVCGWIISVVWIYTLHFLDPFICQWTLGLFPQFGSESCFWIIVWTLMRSISVVQDVPRGLFCLLITSIFLISPSNAYVESNQFIQGAGTECLFGLHSWTFWDVLGLRGRAKSVWGPPELPQPGSPQGLHCWEKHCCLRTCVPLL